MKYAAETGSGAMIYIPSFINISSKFDRGVTQTHKQHGDSISLLLFFFFKIRNVGQKLKSFGVM
jgi:hypothetical protein